MAGLGQILKMLIGKPEPKSRIVWKYIMPLSPPTGPADVGFSRRSVSLGKSIMVGWSSKQQQPMTGELVGKKTSGTGSQRQSALEIEFDPQGAFFRS